MYRDAGFFNGSPASTSVAFEVHVTILASRSAALGFGAAQRASARRTVHVTHRTRREARHCCGKGKECVVARLGQQYDARCKCRNSLASGVILYVSARRAITWQTCRSRSIMADATAASVAAPATSTDQVPWMIRKSSTPSPPPPLASTDNVIDLTDESVVPTTAAAASQGQRRKQERRRNKQQHDDFVDFMRDATMSLGSRIRELAVCIEELEQLDMARRDGHVWTASKIRAAQESLSASWNR